MPQFEERWKPVDGDLRHYLISTHGRVCRATLPERMLIARPNPRGFPVILLLGSDGMTRYHRQINRMVANAFLPASEEEDRTQLWHMDGDLENCRLENLRWERRDRVLEWNRMHREGAPRYKTMRVRNNQTGVTYANAYECGIAEGLLESHVVWRIERQADNIFDDYARYRYVE